MYFSQMRSLSLHPYKAVTKAPIELPWYGYDSDVSLLDVTLLKRENFFTDESNKVC